MNEFRLSRLIQTFRVRKLFATDLHEYRAHLLRLDSHTRYSRFGSFVRDAFIESYVESSFRDDALVFGYVEDGLVRGAAEFRPYRGEHGQHAEVAFSVEDDWRRRGIGSSLFEKLIITARNRQTARLVMHCLPENRAMQNLARHFQARIRLAPDERTGIIVNLNPTAMSLAQEATDDWRAFASAAMGIHRRVWGPRQLALDAEPRPRLSPP